MGTEKDGFIDFFPFSQAKYDVVSPLSVVRSGKFRQVGGGLFYCINIFHSGPYGPHSRSNWTLANPDDRLFAVDCCSH